MGGWGMMPFGGFFWLLALVLIIGVTVAIVRSAFKTRKGSSPALAALQERYAKGEIPRDEYLQKKKDLGV
ncbi:MAG: hypothetical protein KGJ78_19010 [Alphaproteobacteria bacterium]|nr:hypothetical protein [Alphaproteobacteria bacterium]